MFGAEFEREFIKHIPGNIWEYLELAWEPLSRFTRKTMVSEAYGFPLKPFLSVLCYLWPSPHGARTGDGAPADRSDFISFREF